MRLHHQMLPPTGNNNRAIIKETFLHNNALFLAQMFFSLFLLAFSASMIYRGSDPSIYLPIMTSVTSYWFPSPINQKISGTKVDDDSDGNLAIPPPIPPSNNTVTTTAPPRRRRQTSDQSSDNV